MALTEAPGWTGDLLDQGCRPRGVPGPRSCATPAQLARVALALSCAWILAGASRAAGAGIPLRTVAAGSRSGLTEALQIVVRTPAEWTALWTRHSAPGVPLPPVDFAQEMIVAVFLGRRPTSGYQVQITGVHEVGAGPDLEVTYRELDASAGTVRRPVITMPFHIVALPRSAMPVRFRQLPI